MGDYAALTPGAHAFTTASGATLTYYVKGTGPRLLVNVAPGWGCASELYQNSFGFLERDFTVVHLEVRGTRGSSFPADLGDMSSWHMAEDVEALRVHLRRDALDVLGHSNGGCIAVWYASRFPVRVRKLVLVDAQLLGSSAASAPATKRILDARPDRGAVEAWERWGKTGRSTARTDDDFAAGLDSFLALYVAKPERDLAAVKAAFTNKSQIACSKAQGAAEGQHPDQKPELSKVIASTLVIVGREDFICPVPVSKLLAAGIRDSRLHIIEDAGHFGWIEQQAEFSRVVCYFFHHWV
ncbi:alpha/beta-hydrolase [Auricularia subglabra TFB-10046 SS5]|nr:alpha/beta-hydrolase [Auricularia subglabra TFB-10046 SS5]